MHTYTTTYPLHYLRTPTTRRTHLRNKGSSHSNSNVFSQIAIVCLSISLSHDPKKAANMVHSLILLEIDVLFCPCIWPKNILIQMSLVTSLHYCRCELWIIVCMCVFTKCTVGWICWAFVYMWSSVVYVGTRCCLCTQCGLTWCAIRSHVLVRCLSIFLIMAIAMSIPYNFVFSSNAWAMLHGVPPCCAWNH